MKKKILSLVITGVLTMTSITPVFATPNEEVIENQKKYEELNKKIDDIQGEIYSLNEQIGPLVEKIDSNKKQMESIKEEIDNTNKEIDASKEEIKDQEEVLGKRLRELYKSGGQGSYLTLLFSAESFSDLISKIDSASRLVSIDKKIVQELLDKKEKLDEKVASLEEKSNEIAKINEETNKALEESENKKKEQEKLVAEVKAEKEKFDAEYLSVAERTLVNYQIETLKSSSNISDLQSAISQLRSIRDNQLKSPIVIEEVNNAIENGKVRITDLEEQERQRQAAEAAAAEAAANTNVNANTNNSDSSNGGNSSNSSNSGNSTIAPNRGQTSATGNAIVDYAYKFLGTPYVYGATGPDTFDCSGFTSYVYRNAAGIEITRTTYTQIGVGTPVSYDQLQPGDLVFTYGADHVGIYVGGGQYIHAPQPGDCVKVSPVTSFYAARRVL